MSLSEIVIKVIGIILALVGLLLLLAVVGIPFLGVGVIAGSILWNIILGIILIAVGLYILRGGNFTL